MSRLASPVDFHGREHGTAVNGSQQSTAFHDTLCLEDHRLAESIARALHATGHRSLGEVQVTARAGSITLAGHVSSFYLKQVAQEIARQIGGALEVHNQIYVIRACQPGEAR